jgi:cytosine deaminase
LLDAAIVEGGDLLGGLHPAGIDGDMDGHLDALFAIAGRRGVGVDIHLHDGGEGGIAQMNAIAERTRAAGLKGKVARTASKCSAGPTISAMPGRHSATATCWSAPC